MNDYVWAACYHRMLNILKYLPVDYHYAVPVYANFNADVKKRHLLIFVHLIKNDKF